MFKALLRTRFRALTSSMLGRMKKDGKPMNPAFKVLIALLFVYVVAALLFAAGGMFYMIGGPLLSAGLGDLYFALMGLTAVLLGFVGNVFVTQSQLYDARDNELLLSMPIPPSYILGSRMLMLLLLEYLYTALIFLPAVLVYFLMVPFALSRLLFILLGFLTLPLLTLSLSCIFGWVIAMITARLKRKALFQTVFMFLFFGAYLYFYMNLSNYMQTLAAQGATLASAVSRVLPPIAAFGQALDGADPVQFLLLLLWCALPFALIYLLLSKTFVRIATTKTGSVRRKYRAKALRVSSPRAALTRKELSRFFSLPSYVLNAGFGAVIHVILTVVILFRGRGLVDTVSAVMGPVSPEIILLIFVAAASFTSVMTNTTAVSLSLEGKTLWILRGAPVRTGDVLFAKIAVNLIIGLPPLLLSSVAACAVFRFSPLGCLLAFLVPALAQVFAAVWGMMANLLLPRFDWVSETYLIKQSGSSALGIFGGMGALIPPVAFCLLLLFLGAEVTLLLSGVYFALLSGLVLLYLYTAGRRRFERL